MTNPLGRILRYTTALTAASFIIHLGSGFALKSSQAWAANECGTAVAGDTVTCNNDGSPATDTSPYATIAYTVPVHLIVDGTTNPISMTGAITNTGNGNRSITVLGSVSITNPNMSGTVIGSSLTPGILNNSITLGSDVSINVSRTNTAGQLLAIYSRSRDGVNIVNSQADITINQTGAGAAPYIAGLAIQDSVGGANATAEMNLGGNINVTSAGNGTLIGAAIFMQSAGSLSPVLLYNNASIVVNNHTGSAGCYALSAQNAGPGGAILEHNGSISITGNCGTQASGALIELANGGHGFLTINGTIDNHTQSLFANGVYVLASTTGTSLININNNISVSGLAAQGVQIASAHNYTINVADNVLIEASGTTDAYAINGLIGNNGIINIGQNAQLSSNMGTAIATGIGQDTITSSGRIMGSITTGDGNDTVTLLGGSVTGGIEMGADDDALNITGLSATDMGLLTHLDGGTGDDTLSFTNISYYGASLGANDPALGINLGQDWETINFINSEWTLTDNLTLGGSTVNIDANSVLHTGNGISPVIASIIPGDPVTVNNAGTIDIANTPSGTPNTLTIMGNYVGQGGSIVMNMSDTGNDRLIIDGSNGGGSISGTTNLRVNSNTLGTQTTGNGILLVETINGATTTDNAFTLSGGYVGGGAYSYVLSANANQNWYLVSAGLRPEIGLDMTVPALTHQMGLGMLGTLDERVYFDNTNKTPGQDHNHAMWARTFGETGNISSSNNPGYDWTMTGIQTGADLYRDDASYASSRNIAGFYVGAARMDADIAHNIGDAGITSYSAGLYWTHHGAKNAWYTDAVVQGTLFDDIKTSSIGGQTFTTKGRGITTSLEAGQMVYDYDGVTITQQAQLIYQTNTIDNEEDSAGRIAYDTADAVYARLGIKYAKDWNTEQGKITGWIRPNIWHNFNAKSTTTFSTFAGTDAVAVKGDIGNTWGQIGTGISAQVNPITSLYASVDYSAGLDTSGNSIAGRAGIKVRW